MDDRTQRLLGVTDNFTVKDSGTRQEFPGGMVRDTQDGKIGYWRIFQGPLAERYAVHLTKGAQKYPDVRPGVPNWTLAAGEQEYERAKQSAVRHFVQWLRGDTDEDHFAATIFNMNVAEYTKDQLAAQDRAKQGALGVDPYAGGLAGVTAGA